MIAPGSFAKPPAIVTRITLERRDHAFLHSLAEICRSWPELRRWLFEDFVRNEKIQGNFKAWIDAPKGRGSVMLGLAELTEEGEGWAKEKARLQSSDGKASSRIYGGRTWHEMEQLVHRYENGVGELGVFGLTRHWRTMGPRAKVAPELQRAGMEFLHAVMGEGQTQLLGSLARAIRQLERRDPSQRRARIGYTDWWKLQATLYMLRNPQPAYRTRDVRAYLANLGLNVSSLDFRRFTKRHGIRRDMRAGRPRTGRRHPSQ